MNREQRLAAIERRHIRQPLRRGVILMPWDKQPERGTPSMRYHFVASTCDGPKRLDYAQTGRHPREDEPGSWNRHLCFGEPFNG